MENLIKIFLYTHIAAGFMALLVGIIPMASKKGGKVHTQAGQLYTWAMYTVAATAIGLFIVKPYTPSLLYLSCIALLSFYLTYTGVRSVQQKHIIRPTPTDWVISCLALLVGLTMIGLSIWNLAQGSVFLGILYSVFGIFINVIAYKDIQGFRHTTELEKMHWFFLHINRMVGAYIATFTAFCVVNASKIEVVPPLVAWIAPGVIGGIGIARWIRYYRKKMNLA